MTTGHATTMTSHSSSHVTTESVNKYDAIATTDSSPVAKRRSCSPPFSNILEILKRREYGFYHMPHLSCAHIVRSIFKDKANNFFDCTHREISKNGPIYIVENKLFINKLSTCIAFCGQAEPKLKYTVNIPNKKIVDFHTIHAVDLPFAPYPKEEYRNTFYIVTDYGYLHIQDIESGAMLRSIFLSKNRECKFSRVTFQNELDRIYIETNTHPYRKHSKPRDSRASAPINSQVINTSKHSVVYSVIAFQILPLRLMGYVDFTEEIFGKDLKIVDFNNDILITFHGSNKENMRAYIYNFDQILSEENKLFDVHLDKYCTELGGVVGQFPCGIPCNYHIKSLPPVLMHVNCTDDLIDFSPLPKVYIFTSPNQSGLFEVYDVFTRKLIGTVGKPIDFYQKFYELEDDDDIFLDIRDRIVYKNSTKICVFNIDTCDQTNEKRLILNFELKFPILDTEKNEKADKLDAAWKRVMPQRKTKMDTAQRMSKIYETVRVMSFHYNPVLELFLVLAYIPFQASSGSLLLYDAVSGDLMANFHTPFTVNSVNIYNVHMFYDMIFVVEGEMSKKIYTAYTFQLSRNYLEDDIEVE